MSRNQVVIHLCLALILVPFLWLSNDPEFLAALCILDVGTFTLLLTQMLRNRSANLISPALWAILGYLIFGHIPVILNVFVDRTSYSSYNSIPLMIRLVIVGYRAMLGGILLFQPKRPHLSRWAGLRLPSAKLALTLALTGALARVFIRNNVFTTHVEEITWYHSFVFACTPIGIALAIARASQNRGEMRSAAFALTMLFGVATALVDVSRKDTGCILLPIVLFLLFQVTPQRPFLVPTMSRVIKTTAVLLALGVVLMATRALSWAFSNGSDLYSEFHTSMQQRRANDMTNMLAFVLDVVPSSYPYLYGSTLGSLLPVPRVLWPARPPAHSYIVGLQARGMTDLAYRPELTGNNQLSISAHMLGEGYANFGSTGAMAFEFIFGVLIGLYESQLHQGKLFALRILYPVILFFIFTQQRGDLAMMNTEWMMCAGMLWTFLWLNHWIIGPETNRKCRYLHRPRPLAPYA